MGLSVPDIKDMSIWEYMAALDGYIKANSPDNGGLSEKEKDELADWLGI